MNHNSLQQLEQFIVTNNLKTKRGIILFDADINYHHNGIPRVITSNIQIISLPTQMVLYILEFVQDIYDEAEVYPTNEYIFTFTGNTLEIRRDNSGNEFLLSLKPLRSGEEDILDS